MKSQGRMMKRWVRIVLEVCVACGVVFGLFWLTDCILLKGRCGATRLIGGIIVGGTTGPVLSLVLIDHLVYRARHWNWRGTLIAVGLGFAGSVASLKLSDMNFSFLLWSFLSLASVTFPPIAGYHFFLRKEPPARSSATSHTMQSSSITLYDSGRFPLWFRIPALIFGLGVLWLGAAIAADRLFGVSLGMSFSDARGSPLLGALACLVIAAVWILVWFAQLRILFDAAHQELVVWTQGYFHPHERRISVAGGQAIHIHHVVAGITIRKWSVSVEYGDGRSEWVADIFSGVEPLAESLAAATKLPVTKHEHGA